MGEMAIFAHIAIIKHDRSSGWAQCAIDVDVVPRDMPLLLSRPSLCRMGEMEEFDRGAFISKERAYSNLVINGANHYLMHPIPSISTDEHMGNVWNTREDRSNKEIPDEGAGGVSHPQKVRSVEGRADVIPPPPVGLSPTRDESVPNDASGSDHNPNIEDQDAELTEADIGRIPIQLGRDSKRKIQRAAKNAKRKVYIDAMRKVLKRCACDQ